MTTRFDPDQLAALEDERDFLLRSLDDLEAEHRAGDIDDDDFAELHDDYTARSAAVIRSINDQESAARPVDAAPGGRRLGWLIGLAAFAIGIGVLLAQFAGERGANDQITGGLDENLRDKNLRCQQLGAQQQISDALTCFDEVLAEDPQNVEALSYRGWFLVLTVGSAQASGEDEAAGQLLVVAEENLSEAVAIDPEYAPARAFRTVVFDRKGDTEAACGELEVLATLDTPPIIRQLTEPVEARLDCS